MLDEKEDDVDAEGHLVWQMQQHLQDFFQGNELQGRRAIRSMSATALPAFRTHLELVDGPVQ